MKGSKINEIGIMSYTLSEFLSNKNFEIINIVMNGFSIPPIKLIGNLYEIGKINPIIFPNILPINAPNIVPILIVQFYPTNMNNKYFK